MKRLWSMFLIAAFSFCCVGCGPSAVDEVETEVEMEEDLAGQEEMMDEMESEAPESEAPESEAPESEAPESE